MSKEKMIENTLPFQKMKTFFVPALILNKYKWRCMINAILMIVKKKLPFFEMKY